MKVIVSIWISIFLGGTALQSETIECLRKSTEAYRSEKEACGSLFGVEKTNCVETAKEKLRSSNQDCKAKYMECISKATSTKSDSKKSCSGKEASEKSSCLKSSEEEFVKSKYDCRRI